MIHSMTGYGRAQQQADEKTFTVEMRSLNSKGVDLSLKLPFQFREKEMDARNTVSSALERGKIDVFITVNSNATSNYELNSVLANKYHNQLKELLVQWGYTPNPEAVSSLFRFPDVVTSQNLEFNESEWKVIEKLISFAIEQLKSFRKQEGLKLEADIRSSINVILENLSSVNKHESERTELVRAKLLKQLEDLKLKEGHDKNRFEQELIYYLEKMDVNEEKVRLKAHCDYFIKTMETENSPGRKLGFISQEMGREINTLGSKCNHAEIQKLVVMMKDALEKIKEQCLNIL